MAGVNPIKKLGNSNYIIGYKEKRIWKFALLVFALFIGISSLLYTNQLVDKLMKEEKKKVELYARAYEKWAQLQSTYDDDPAASSFYSFLFEEIIQPESTIPLILVSNGEIISSKNFDSSKVKKPGYLEGQLEEMESQRTPFEIDFLGNKQYVYYKNSNLIIQLRYFPYVQLFIITLFILVAYLAFSSSRKYEQNRVWVGMAKETAHQLGTPLSSLMGWTEYLRNSTGKPPEEVIEEIEKDINRLDLITERFSKIGSIPTLQEQNVHDVISRSLVYLRNRFSKKAEIYIHPDSDNKVFAMINTSLFDWVVENLVKNAIDAMPKKGEIIFLIEDKGNSVVIDVTDTGKGIPRGNHKNIFHPGYTTKKRGWGLGLSLVKRIIHNYHKGEIYIKTSEPGKGTTFRIKLRKLQG